MDKNRSGDRINAFWQYAAFAQKVHPGFSNHAAVKKVVLRLADIQTLDGDWGEEIPFFQTLNAISHLNTPESDAQCQKAIKLVASTQNADGSWGKGEREWSTFLAIHALKNKGLL